MAKSASKGKKRVIFEIDAPAGSKVFVTGSFNDWAVDSKPLTDKGGVGRFRALCFLPQGTYEYKFVVDGTWCIDPNNPNFVPNDMGTLNSVVTVE